MLTRLKVSGFKNLESVDVRFGPFTCVLGLNGVGKSNLFDAIALLAALADKSLAEAAASVRGAEGRVGDVRALFQDLGGGRRAAEMSFVAEMIIPASGVDDLGSPAVASMTFLRYELALRRREEGSNLGPLEVARESLEHINKTGSGEVLGFPSASAWRDSVITGRRTVPYIETVMEDGKVLIKTRSDAEGGGGSPRKALARNMPRTVLSTANNAAEHRTLVLARHEMMGWTQFQLEPSALRAPDALNAPGVLSSNGAHLPATLNALGREHERVGLGTAEDIQQQVANRLAQLYESVRTLRVERDEKRELLSIVLEDVHGAEHPAASLSDGTLRFLALAILEASPQGPSVLCLEEPENGIHPERIPAMIQLLRDIAVDTGRPVGADNPMRQVIVNTHSPGVAQVVPDETLVVAEGEVSSRAGRLRRTLRLRGMRGTWRGSLDGASVIPLVPYLLPVDLNPGSRSRARTSERRLADREDVQQLRLFPSGGESAS